MDAQSVSNVSRPPQGGVARSRNSNWFVRQAALAPYAFISPFYILFLIFFLIPTLAALVLSFFKWNGIGAPEWVGIRNFTRIFEDPIFWQSVGNTAVYVFASLWVVIPLALVLAAALNSHDLGLRPLWRSMFFSPVVTSTVAITLVFALLYSKDFGLVNAALVALGFERINWLGDGTWAKISIVLLLIWRWTGFTMIYFLAGMQSIPQELYEATEIDGATGAQQFFNITVPLLRPVILYVSVLVIIGSLQIFEEPFILTAGGPANATMSVAQYLYVYGISQLRLGFGSAVGLLLFAVMFVVSLIQMRAFGIFRED